MLLKKSCTNRQLLYSLKIGDGCYVQNSSGERFGEVTYYLDSSSINLDYVVHKKVVLEKLGILTRAITERSSGYKKSSIVYGFQTKIHPLITEVGNMTILEVLEKLDIQGLVYYFLDDGTFHQRKHFGQLYCNTFSDKEVELLINVMYKYYPQKKCSKRIDQKKDGRKYPYIYIPVVVMNEFRKDIEKFLIKYDVQSLRYKIGGIKNESSCKI